MAKPKQRWTGDASNGPFNNPFAALKAEAGELPAAPESARPEPGRTAPEPEPATVRRAVVRLEKKGRAGKQVTVVEQLELSPEALAEWANALKQTLGCGGTVEGETIVVQGDHRARTRAFLESRGVRKISVG